MRITAAVLPLLALFSSSCAVVVPAPVVVSASQFFEGNDGPWSSFEFRIGTPAQNVRFLPGTSSTATLVVLPQGCISGQPSDCANARGGLFNITASSTWIDIGIYGLGFENHLGYNDAGQFGFDTVGLGYQGSGGPTVNHSVVAGIAGTQFFLGVLGLNPHPTNFTDLNDPKPSYVKLLRDQNDIPSLSYSYTAGAQYRQKMALGSLILGGYDASRFAPSNISFGFLSDQSKDLSVGLQRISTNATGSETSLLSSGINIFIDSSVAQLYLPLSVCQAFESAFGITYDSTTSLYLVNDTLHAMLLSSNPSVTFTLGNTVSGGETLNVTLPYASFDLLAEYPLVSNTTRYFPLRRATNDTQYTLGRAFLQEAYLTVDYERGNFSVNPCIWDSDAAGHIVSIPSLNTTSNSNSTDVNAAGNSGTSGNQSISSGAIAGIAIGTLILVAVVGLVLWFKVLVPRRRKRAREKTEAEEPAPVAAVPEPTDGAGESESVKEAAVPELHGEHKFEGHEAEGDSPQPPVRELPDGMNPAASELPSPPAEVSGTQIYEMPGSDVPEMSGDEKRRKFSFEDP